MKFYLSICLAFLCVIGMQAQVPSPSAPKSNSQPDYIGSFTWNKTSASDYELFDSNGNRLTSLMYLTQLSSDTVAVLHKGSRSVLLLPDFDSVSEGGPRDGYILKRNISKNFYVTNPNSYITYVDDESYSPEVTNVSGTYVAYVSELDKTYLEEGIRLFPAWGVKDLVELPAAPDNTYWYRDRAQKEYGIIIKGATMDYTNVTSEVEGDDRIVKDNGKPVYRLPDYENTASFVYKPVSLDVSSSASSSAEQGCTVGDCENGFGKFVFENGYYDGFWSNGLKQGYGLYSWDSGGTYVGNWQADNMTGYGIYTAENDDIIKGIFKDGNLNGLGVTRTGEDWEQGIYNDGSLSTAYTFYGNDVDTGCTIGDCQNKYGKMTWSNGDTFVGFFKNGAMHIGTYSFASGDKYSGQFNQDNQFDGMGRFWFEDGTYYGGAWRNGQYHGNGYYSPIEGDKQVGRFSNGQFQGN